MRRRGFTLVELMMVIAVIAVLMTIVTTASLGAIRSSRSKRADAMLIALQASIATYRAANSAGEWPGALENYAENAESAVLSESDAQNVFRIIVQKSTGKNGTILPLIDPHGLFVAPEGVEDGKGTGLSYDEAIRQDSRHQKLTTDRMVFGYQGVKTGKFHRFNIVYHAETDMVTVHKCCHECLTKNGTCSKNGQNNKCEKCHRYEQE